MSATETDLTRRDRGRLIILVNQDWFFLSHFADRALAAQRDGYRVTVICPDSGRADEIVALGFHHMPLSLRRHGANPLGELRPLLQLRRAYRELRPDLAWHIGLKAIVLGTLASIWAGRSGGIVNAPVGMGFVFASNGWTARLLRPVVRAALRLLLNPPNSRVVFENGDDMRELIDQLAVHASEAVLIRGAGVDLTRYAATPEPGGVPVVLFASRLIWEKGVGVFAEASGLLAARGVRAHFVIAGGVDRGSSSAVPESQLRRWAAEGVAEWLGPRSDMPELLAGCTVFCLPTWYREGLPKVLLEAMACQRAVVTTDAVGCREAVAHLDNGLLIPPKDPLALADAIERLLGDAVLRCRLAARGRQRAEREFGSEAVCRQTMEIFSALRDVAAESGVRGCSLNRRP